MALVVLLTAARFAAPGHKARAVRVMAGVVLRKIKLVTTRRNSHSNINRSAHCGTGCQSGPCLAASSPSVAAPVSSPTVKVTTDGTCGAAYGNSICGAWAQGSCCSSYGWCGNT
jgi:hypothetical protein